MEENEITPVKPKRGRPRKQLPLPGIPEPAYQDPIAVAITMRGGQDIRFRCVDYDVNAVVWRFKSFPPERGRQTVRLISSDEVAFCRIDEPEKPFVPTAIPASVPSNWSFPAAAPPPAFTYSGPQNYVAKDHLANRAEGGLVNGIPQSVAKDEDGNVTRIGAAMIQGGQIS